MKRIKKNTEKKIPHFVSALLLACILSGCGQQENGLLLPGTLDMGQDRSLPDAPALEEGSGQPLAGEDASEAPESASQIYVQVSGAVAKPGVYALPPEARIFQAIELAGGLTEEADVKSLNQAEPLADGQMVYVMSQEEAAAQALSQPLQEGQGEPEDGRVNLNTATESDLMALPGIGEAKAKAILDWREEHGGFSQVEDLMQVQGIKEGVFTKIKDSIKVE